MFPINFAGVLASSCIFRRELHAGECSSLAGHGADKFDYTVHVAGHHDGVSHVDVRHDGLAGASEAQ